MQYNKLNKIMNYSINSFKVCIYKVNPEYI